MANQTLSSRSQSEPEAANAQPVDPVEQAKEMALQTQSHETAIASMVDAPSRTATNPPTTGQSSLQDILPEITDLARKVGGMKQLLEIISTLEKSKA